MPLEYLILLLISIPLLIYGIVKTLKESREQNRLLEVIENQPQYNYYKIFPHEVEELKIKKLNNGNFRFSFTPISIQQIEKVLFVIGVKAIYKNKKIGFDLILNGITQKCKVEGTEIIQEMNLLGLDTSSKESDLLINILAETFGIELANNAQIIKYVELFSEKIQINLESIMATREIISFHLNEVKSEIIPGIKIGLNIKNKEIYLEELDQIYRPIIVNRFLFKPNIRIVTNKK